MAVINVLPKQVAELIAAGEVVERPSSVIKELVENSIDAGSTLITVEIKNGGVTFMRVTDNGCGIAREDVTTAFKRHATSKVKTESDLNGIATLGFRGEALAAISSVSRIEMLTKQRSEPIGTAYFSEGGTGVDVNDAGCPDGTTVIVRDLFFNTPARMKFLKKDTAEGNSVGAVLDHIALSHPEVSFRFIRDGKQVFATPGDGQLKSAVYAVCGREFSASLIPVNGESGGIKVTGFTCKPTACRPKKNAQFVFLNGRYVRSGTVSSALEAAYKNMAMVGRFPAAVLHLTVPYGAVDINVHPAKTEVRFSDERRIFDCVMFAVKNALAAGDSRPEMNLPTRAPQRNMMVEEYRQTVLPEVAKTEKGELRTAQYEKMITAALSSQRNMQLRQSRPNASGYYEVPTVKSVTETEKTAPSYGYSVKVTPPSPDTEKTVGDDASAETDSGFGEVYTEKAEKPQVLANPDNLSKPSDITDEKTPSDNACNGADETLTPDIEYIGEAFKTYIIVRRGESLFLIDKHAAHERMIFNRLKSEAEANPQMLLEPEQVTLRFDEYSVITDDLELLLKAGFEIDDYGDCVVLVRAVPSALIGESVGGLLTELAANLADKKAVEVERLERIYETVACRAAVKGGNLSSDKELKALAETVLGSKEIMYCPHGRPVAMELKRREIEKQFGRIQ